MRQPCICITSRAWFWYASLFNHVTTGPRCVLAGLFSKDLYLSSQAYSIDKWWFGLYHGIYSLAETLAVLWFGYLPWVWQLLPKIAPAAAAPWMENELVHTVVFVLVISLLGMITQLPCSIYSTFVLEERHGFNKQTLGRLRQRQRQLLYLQHVFSAFGKLW